MQEKTNWGSIITYAGAFIALLIGSGFATGQEIMQYFTSYGMLGAVGILIMFVLFVLIGTELIQTGHESNIKNPNDVYKIVCGKYIGTFFDYFSVFFLFLSYTVMIAGAQATAEQQFNAVPYIGGAILAVVVMATVFFGLSRIVDVIGKIGPVIVVLAIGVGLISILMNLGSISNAQADLEVAIASGKMSIASSNFLFSAASYVGFCVIWLAGFLSSLGKSISSLKEGKQSVFLGALGFALACLVVMFAIYLSIGKVYHTQIPLLILAGEITPVLSYLFAVIIFAGIYTTAVPLLWNVCARFAEEKTKRYQAITLILGVIGAIIGLTINFKKLVNIVYVLNGYIGFIVIVFLLFRYVMRRVK